MKRTALSITATFALAAMAIGTASAQNIPPGSYQQSCTNIRVRGDVLTARCNAPQGGTVRSSIALDNCRRGDIANTNGQLTCNTNGYGRGRNNGNGYGYGNNGYGNNGNGNNGYGNNGYGNNGYGNNGYGRLPGGSYQQSCSNATMNGGTLTANCPAGNGARVTSSINPRSCGGADIANRNGRLQCG
jgi:CVNH domain-containing protein